MHCERAHPTVRPFTHMAQASRAWVTGDYSWDSVDLLAVRKPSRDDDIVCQVRGALPSVLCNPRPPPLHLRAAFLDSA